MLLMTIAAPTGTPLGTGGKLLGSVGAGAVAIALFVLLVFGIRGKGMITLKSRGAFVVGFLAIAACTTAGQVWTLVPDAGASLGESIRASLSGAGFGEVGMGGICLIATILALVINITPALGGWAGLILSSFFTAAGGIWMAAPLILTTTLTNLLAKVSA